MQKSNLLFAPPVFEHLFGHGGGDDDDERDDTADGGVRGDGEEGQDCTDEEIEIGDPPELLEQGLGEEGGERVFSGSHVIVAVILRNAFFCGIVAIHYPRESRPSNQRMLPFIERRFPPTRERVDSAKMVPLPSSSMTMAITPHFSFFFLFFSSQKWWFYDLSCSGWEEVRIIN